MNRRHSRESGNPINKKVSRHPELVSGSFWIPDQVGDDRKSRDDKIQVQNDEEEHINL